MNLSEAFAKSFSLHPDMCMQDAVKFLFQAEYGGGHMISDENASLLRLEREMAETDYSSSAPVYESLGEKTVRLNLAAIKGKLSPAVVNRLFVRSAEKIKGSVFSFEESLSLLYGYFDKAQINSYLEKYKSAGYPAVSHTEDYRKKYSPAYRVISSDYAKYLPVLMTICATDPRLVAIDGRCGSGKTTLSRLLEYVYDCNVFHADDFFLPLEMRTEERLSAPGGNMHRERLLSEVIIPIKEKRTAQYRKFICSSCTFSEPYSFSEKPLNIIEGSYSLHPELRDYYDLRIFADIDSKTQLERIKARESEDSFNAFIEKWIPMEERYFSQCNVEQCADIIIR